MAKRKITTDGTPEGRHESNPSTKYRAISLPRTGRGRELNEAPNGLFSRERMGLTAHEMRIISDLARANKTVFSLDELTPLLESRDLARKFVSRLSKKRELERLGKGVYLIVELAAGSTPQWTADSFYIASKIAGQYYYIGYYNMLNEYGWTEQVPVTVSVATTTVLKSRTIHGVSYNFITISKKKFFGTAVKFINGHEIVISDPEKTIVDSLDRPELCGGILEVAKALYNAQKQVDWNKAVDYAKKLGNGAVFKRLGYLAELMELVLPEGMPEELKRNVTPGYSSLCPGVSKVGKHNSRWNIIINVKISKELVLA